MDHLLLKEEQLVRFIKSVLSAYETADNGLNRFQFTGRETKLTSSYLDQRPFVHLLFSFERSMRIDLWKENGPIAQFRLERTPDKREVTGSSPVRPTTCQELKICWHTKLPTIGREIENCFNLKSSIFQIFNVDLGV